MHEMNVIGKSVHRANSDWSQYLSQISTSGKSSLGYDLPEGVRGNVAFFAVCHEFLLNPLASISCMQCLWTNCVATLLAVFMGRDCWRGRNETKCIVPS